MTAKRLSNKKAKKKTKKKDIKAVNVALHCSGYKFQAVKEILINVVMTKEPRHGKASRIMLIASANPVGITVMALYLNCSLTVCITLRSWLRPYVRSFHYLRTQSAPNGSFRKVCI